MTSVDDRYQQQLTRVKAEREASRDAGGLGGGGGGPHVPGMEPRVAALEAAVTDMRVILGRIDERTAVLASKSDLAGLRTDVMVELAGKSTKGTVWSVGITLAALVVAAVALGAVYMPYLATLYRRAGQ